MSEEKIPRESDVSKLLGLINSALIEQDGLIQRSFELFDPVLKQVNPILDPTEECKEGYDSSLANNLMSIKNDIVAINNLIITFNKKCDL